MPSMPMITGKAVEKIDRLVENAISQARGCFYPPMVLANVSPASDMSCEEIVGHRGSAISRV